MRKSIVLLAFMLMAGMMPARATHYDFSATVSSGQTLFFKIEGNGVNVVSQYSQANATNYDDNNRPTGNLVIPNSISNDSASYVVVGIGTYAFRDCAGLSSVIIPNSVTSIGRQAFAGCTGLTAMTIPSSVTSIDGAFVGCANLLAVSLPNSISSMDGAFAGCSSLLSVNIPTSVSSIGFMTFYNCSSLDSISIPSSVNTIAANAFRGCTSLAFIEVESGNQLFDSRDNCNAIVVTASDSLIQGCSTTVIPNTVKSIGDYAFSGCSGLTSVVVTNDIELTAVFVENTPNDVNVVDDENVRIYPNPTSGNLTIEAEDFLFAELFAPKGNRLAVYRNANNIDISRFPGGRYLFGIRTRKYYVYRTIVISK